MSPATDSAARPADRPAAAVADDLAACRARDAALGEQLAAAEARVASTRDAIGAAVAVGDEVRALRTQLRDAEDEVDGLTRGRAVLARTRATLEAEHAAAVVRDARAAEAAAVGEAIGAAEALEAAVDRFVADTFAPLAAAAQATGAAARSAEQAAARARHGAGAPATVGGPLYDFWQARRGLDHVLTTLDNYRQGHAAGRPARSVDAPDRPPEGA